MIPEEQKTSSDEMQKAMRALHVRMTNTALGHLDSIGLRHLLVLQNLELINKKVPSMSDDVDLDVLRNQHDVRRQNLHDGPLVIYLTNEDQPKRMVVELPVLLLSEDQEVRQTALECIEMMLAKDSMFVTPKTVVILKEARDALVSEIPEDWRPAAINVCDSLYDDILITLHGVQQCLQSDPVLQDSLQFFSPKAIHPSVSSLDSICLPIGNPERDHEALTKLLSDLVASASNLAELCDAYLANLGFLPLASPYSLGAAVKKLLASNSSIDTWQEVWGWANAESTPISRYHACTVFILLPELIPDGKLSDLWNEVLNVILDSDKMEADRPNSEPWALRRDLARHYLFHLEARLPDSDGAGIACFAWWLAEQVAALLPADTSAVKFYRENWVKPASALSCKVWLAASSPIQRSFLRYVTFSVQAPWAVALLAIMGEHLDELDPSEQTEDVQARFHDALVSCTVSLLPFPTESLNDPTFAQEYLSAFTVLKWAEYQTEEQRIVLQQCVEASRTLENKDGLCDALRKLGESRITEQAVVCLALKTMVFTDPTIAEDVWGVISDSEWRKNVFAKLDHQAQDLLIESLNMLLIDNRDKGFLRFPHYLAELCEEEGDEERRRVLFLYVIHTSLASDTVSAVQRLLRGDQKEKFVEYVKEYREHSEFMRSDYPPWAAGKLRGLMASMHVL